MALVLDERPVCKCVEVDFVVWGATEQKTSIRVSTGQNSPKNSVFLHAAIREAINHQNGSDRRQAGDPVTYCHGVMCEADCLLSRWRLRAGPLPSPTGKDEENRSRTLGQQASTGSTSFGATNLMPWAMLVVLSFIPSKF
jgi:hypothetical protein